MLGPNRRCREITVVNSSHFGINREWMPPSEDRTRPPNLDSLFALHVTPIYLEVRDWPLQDRPQATEISAERRKP
jgi:hypothetical protein